ncbi:MAG: hypothetical protein AB8B64_11580 [Granulosicoccus sp.]
MNTSRLLPFALIILTSSAYATDHSGASPAAHMQLKDSAGNVVCFAYDTDEATAPIATACPEGTYTEQLFDSTWAQTGQRSVVIGNTTAPTTPTTNTLRPTRVERTCVWDENRIRSTFGSAEGAENRFPTCTITCPAGVAIDGEARATIPGFFGSDDEFSDGLTFTEGTGTETITIHMDTTLAVDVVFDRFRINGSISEFGDLTYVIDAAAVCL